ncbi:MAG: hypothetical protein QHH19_05935 [Candidatus Thermoplasmatota archaeon]|jgi:hypothetical protein|nr:hypothetical protein [Candidatus Thermoplasmatota archaeon]
MDIFASIRGIDYTPLLCKELNTYSFQKLGVALENDATFVLSFNRKNQIAVSWWVSAKRTRSYPYARIYDSLKFSGRRVTIIPIVKDEGFDGDRDFLQWDTISLMSLLGVYVIISYYGDALQSSRYKNKITKQRFNIRHVKRELKKLLSYQSDALHWNLMQIENVGKISRKALESYGKISQKLGVKMHSRSSAEKRIKELLKGKESFINLSRNLAEKAQKRESVTKQPKEKLTGKKATLTIKNYLGGYYFFTVDEFELHGKDVYLIEGKHTKQNKLPSNEDIKDGLLKMILFTNLKDVIINNKKYNSISLLKLTTKKDFKLSKLNKKQKQFFTLLKKEAKTNDFKIMVNNKII